MNKISRILVLSLSLLVCSGCSMTLPVKGQFETGSVTFTGSATGYLDGSGTIRLVATNGLKVDGDFIYVTQRNGEGVFTASDGRSASFKFGSTGRKGTGTGYLGNDKVTFTFGMK